MSTTTRWWWVRHAPVVAMDGKAYGNSEVDCDVSDTAAFRALAARIPDNALWVTSHLGRAKLTAAAIAEAGGYAIEPLVEPDLAEQNFGDWQGRTWADIEAELEANGERVYHKFWAAPARHAPPGGETFVNVVARVGAVVERLTTAHAGRDIVAVAHGGTIRAALAIALGVELDAALAFSTANLAITRLDHVPGPGPGGDWRIAWVNHPPS